MIHHVINLSPDSYLTGQTGKCEGLDTRLKIFREIQVNNQHNDKETVYGKI